MTLTDDFAEPNVRLSKALIYMTTQVNNKESLNRRRVSINPNSTHSDYVDATYAFLETLPAFSAVSDIMLFMNNHLIERDEHDPTQAKDVPDYWIDLHE